MQASSNPNKLKIFNDPVYGFINVPSELIFDLIEHPYFQRLRRIKQLGLTHLVYPGALHTRFHHTMGAMFLMNSAIDTLRSKGHHISQEESEAVSVAILLHDIGHGPFSHALEHSIANHTNHEFLSELFMQKLNQEFKGQLDMAIDIFNNKYSKKFLHQLVSSQLDMDRLDYLKRDSFFTGVSEGVISTERIIKMFNVVNDELVVDVKGIYSVEKFIIARRLMYWQVYLHKTVIAAEQLLILILRRAKELALMGSKLFASPSFEVFLTRHIVKEDFIREPQLLDVFAQLDDYDIFTSIKVWQNHPDIILSTLSKALVSRALFKIELQNTPFEAGLLEEKISKVLTKYQIPSEMKDYFIFVSEIENNAYNPSTDNINILLRNGELIDLANASDQLNIRVLSQTVKKHFFCYPSDKMMRNFSPPY